MNRQGKMKRGGDEAEFVFDSAWTHSAFQTQEKWFVSV